MSYLRRYTVVFVIMALTHTALAWSARLAGAETIKTQQEVAQSPHELKRADFRVTGTSCASCLHHIAREINATPGVIKTDVSIFYPYHGVVIYSGEKTSLKKIFESVTDKSVKFADVKDSDIAEIPSVIIPK
ncbi:MAG: heavy-metal-associated domain-containing protein [Candidatus Melainabacteria bacterium]|nr:heavy-metal-associated domain-containing protein [Candidatus Melainabacteria bacterium]